MADCKKPFLFVQVTPGTQPFTSQEFLFGNEEDPFLYEILCVMPRFQITGQR